jgi:hypothetical protein
MRRKKKQRSSASSFVKSNPALGDIAYEGAAVPAITRSQARVERQLFTVLANSNLQTTVQASTFSSDVATVNPVGLGNFTASYQEYRVLAMTIEHIPGMVNASVDDINSNTIDQSLPDLWYIERGNSTTPTQTLWSRAVESQRAVSLNSRFKMSVKARGADELAWVPTTATLPTANEMQINLVREAIVTASSSIIGFFQQTWLVEFRNRT